MRASRPRRRPAPAALAAAAAVFVVGFALEARRLPALLMADEPAATERAAWLE